jgi:hypothetical protein
MLEVPLVCQHANLFILKRWITFISIKAIAFATYFGSWGLVALIIVSIKSYMGQHFRFISILGPLEVDMQPSSYNRACFHPSFQTIFREGCLLFSREHL